MKLNMPRQPFQPDADLPILADELLRAAAQASASDVHLEPTAGGFDLKHRTDGILHVVRQITEELGRRIVSRWMVQAQLLTYRLDVPQEGTLALEGDGGGSSKLEMRLSIMPTTHGLRAVVRLPAELRAPRSLDELGLPSATLAGLHSFAMANMGILLLTGPAGSGKTTTIYALLEHLVATQPGLSIVSLEDPVERDIAGVTQIEVSPFGKLTYETVLRSMLRQDPQILVLGEIRDAATAALAVQAGLSGHRLISTLHAGSIGGAIVRLLDMGIGPYQVASSLFGIVAMRLVRRCDGNSGYRGRVPVSSFAAIDDPLRQAVLARASSLELDAVLAQQASFASLESEAAKLVVGGVTDEAELRRAGL